MRDARLRERDGRGHATPPVNWTDFAHFLALVRAGTLRAAARELRVAPTTVSRRVSSLEAAVGAPLFVRGAGGLAPTAAARELAAQGREVEARMASLARHVAPGREAVAGEVRVSATEIVTSEILAPAVAALLARHPALRVTLRVDARLTPFSRDDTDLAVRLVRPAGARLVARKVATIALGLYAARAYLARPGERAFADERFLTYDESYGPIAEVRWFEARGLAGAVVLRTSSTRALLAAALAGAGVGLLPEFLAAREPELVRVESPAPLPTRAVYLVTHEDLRRRPAVAAAWGHLVEAFARLAGPSAARRESSGPLLG